MYFNGTCIFSVAGRLLQNAILIKTRKNFILYKKAGGKRQAKKDFRTFEYTKTEANGVCLNIKTITATDYFSCANVSS